MSNQDSTETYFYDQARKSTNALLAALIEHHDYRMQRPLQVERRDIPIFEVPPTVEKIEVCILPIQSPKITIDAIKRVVCRHYGISHSDIISPRRDKKVGRPRMVAIYLSREFTEFGLPTIGRRFGNRDHTTALHSCRRMADLIMTDPVIAADVKSLSEQLTA